jgi:uncharacterized protein (UPF0333 family)
MASEPKEIIVERSGGNGLTAIIAIIIIALIAVGAYLVIHDRTAKDNAITTAAQQVGDAAEKAGDAAQDAAKRQ